MSADSEVVTKAAPVGEKKKSPSHRRDIAQEGESRKKVTALILSQFR